MEPPKVNNVPGTEEQKLFVEKAKFFREHVQAVLNLATGSLVLSVTFLHDKGNSIARADLLKSSWLWLLAAIVLGLAYNYVLSIRAKESTERYRILMGLLSAVFHLSFLVAMYYLFRFGIGNI